MKLRILTGVGAALFVLGLIFYGPQWLVLGVVCAVGLVAYWEYDRLFIDDPSPRRQAAMSVLLLWTFISLDRGSESAMGTLLMCFVLLGVGGVIQGYMKKDLALVARRMSAMVTGYIYTVCVIGMILPIMATYGRGALLYLFLVVFTGDTVAYFVGSRLGKNKLAKRISPGKTIEGSLAAFVSAIVVSFVLQKCSDTCPFFGALGGVHSIRLLFFAIVLSFFAQAGDLFESILKRSQAQKDSGTLLPGHGGILDRIDGLAFSAPMFYVFFGSL